MSNREHLLAWLDDFAVYAPNEARLLDVLEVFFHICKDKNLKISLKKSVFFATTIKWCGRLIDAHGVKMDPSKFQGLLDAEMPRTANELLEYVHCVAWMACCIPQFSQRVAPLSVLLETAYERSGKRTKKSVAKFSLAELGWNAEHAQAFNGLQQQLVHQVHTAHRNPALSLCVFTDASDDFWAAAVTQRNPAELSKPVDQQSHKPLAFLSGGFTHAQEHWSTYEKEAFAVVETFRKMSYLLACNNDVTVFTDHRNLLFTFNPLALEPSLGRHKVLKVLRWALFLSTFSYTIGHVPGELNTMADIQTRWMRGYRGHRGAIKRVAYDGVPTAPLADDDSWPSRTDIVAAQSAYTGKHPPGLSRDEDNLAWKSGKIWIPATADALKLKLLTIAHAVTVGHRGIDATAAILSAEYTWVGMRRDVHAFVDDCLLCVMAKSGNKVPRPLATTLHACKPNEVIHFDYLFL